MTGEALYAHIRRQLALELGCEPEDFLRGDTVITRPVLHEERRRFSEKPFFLQMVTFGDNAVISADERIHPWLRDWVRDKRGIWLFEQDNFYALECELRRYGCRMFSTHHMFLPLAEPLPCRSDLRVRWLEREEIAPFYAGKEFPNAICDRFYPERPDVLAVVALDGDRIIGMAGCSADTPELWQIGIDVLPPYRRLGGGTALVTLLRQEILRRGAIPYYGTRLSNLASWKIALSSGFRPAWVETESRELTKDTADH